MERVVGDEFGERVGDPSEQVVEVLLGEDVVEDLRQAAVGLDERRYGTGAEPLVGDGKDGRGNCPSRAHMPDIGMSEKAEKSEKHPNE